MPRRRCAPTAPTWSASSCASACWWTFRSATSRTTIIGEPVPLPLGLGPVALTGMQHRDGEIAACRAAQAAGIPYCLSTMSICSIEDVAEAVDKPFWFQLYVMKDRGFVKSLIERAAAAKCSALVLTIDLQVLGQRHCDMKNGLSGAAGDPPAECAQHRDQAGLGVGHADAASARPSAISPAIPRATPTSRRWRRGFRRSSIPRCRGRTSSGSKACGRGNSSSRACSTSRTHGSQPRPAPNAIVVSNHGGRQLDGAPSSISALPQVADAVGADIEIMFDGGIRSGQDLMRALALGARSCLIGRSLYLRARRRRTGRRGAGDRDHPQRARRDHGAVRRQPGARHRPARDRADVIAQM